MKYETEENRYREQLILHKFVKGVVALYRHKRGKHKRGESRHNIVADQQTRAYDKPEKESPLNFDLSVGIYCA